MKIIALYKVWSGEEWLRPSIQSIYPFVHKIYILTSKVSWIGGLGNPSFQVIDKILQNDDKDSKVIHINHDEPNQIKHCQFGYEIIRRNHPDADFIQLIDSDELWDQENYEKAIDYLNKNPGVDAYRTQMYTYVKTPFLRVDPPESLKPVCFITLQRPDMGTEPRGCGIHPFKTMPDVWCHHFVFVRAYFNKVLEKLIQSHVSEKQPYASMDKWIPEVWNRLPSWNKGIFSEGFHPAIGYQKNWSGLKEITIQDLPEILHGGKFPEVLSFGK
ncbi:MAG: hypothetical protein ACFFDN_02105 [Candidatus Hodarchaeota archaeon]